MTAAQIRNKCVFTKNKMIWKSVLLNISNEISKTEFITWFSKTIISSFNDNVINISVATNAAISKLSTKYINIIQDSIKKIVGDGYKINFILDTNLLYKDDRAIRLSDINRTINNTNIQSQVFGIKEEENLYSKNTNKYFSLENFIIGPSNQIAFACIDSIYKGKSLFNPLFIYSNAGLGKTHLLQGLYNDIKKKNPNSKIIYNTAEKFTTEIVEVISKGTKAINEFRYKYRSVNILIIDDIQFLANKEKTQEEFFHLFNILADNNKQVILSADIHPSKINNFNQRLLSRFASGMIVDIEEPDYETIIHIIRQKALDIGLFINNNIIEYIAQNTQKNIRYIEGVLKSLYFYISTLKLNISFDILKPIIDKILCIDEKNKIKKENKSINEIISYIANYLHIDEKLLYTKSKLNDIVLARSICMYVIKEKFKLPFEEIGKYFKKNHATVIHAYNKIKKELIFNKSSEISNKVLNILQNI